MSFRAKLLTVVGLIIIVSVVLSFTITYFFARQQLEKAAKKETEQTVSLITKQSQIALNTIKVDMELLADLQLIHTITRFPKNKALVNETNRYFQQFVNKNKVYQSINLLNSDALCIASSYPDRIGYVTMQRFVQTRSDFQTALSGKTSVSQILLSMGTGRPFIAVSTPVIQNGVIKAVVRAILDLDYLNDFFLRPQEFIYGGKAYFYDPRLDMTLPEGWKIPNVIKAKPYVRPGIPDLPEAFSEASVRPKWYGDEIPEFKYNIEEKERRIAALEIINDFPFWKGDLPFRQSLCQYYERAADLAEEILTGEKKKTVGRPRKLI